MEKASVFTISSLNSEENEDFLLALVAQAKQGQERAFGEIYNLYFKKIYKFIFYRVGHKETAEDLAEDVFLKAYAKISSLENPKTFEGWLYQISRNRVIDYYREKKITVALEDVENTLEYESNILDVLNLQDDQKVFLKLLRELPTEQQIVIKLKFLEHLENPQIAELLHKSEGAIRVIQHRAIAKLQLLFKDQLERINGA
jgi:RNA polymerase sigma-70 factor (ECF subfamily)